MIAPAAPRLGARCVGWARHHAPTRESIERNRLLRPVSRRILTPSLWRFNRRSVPRGVALGLGLGMLFPFAHMPMATVLAFPARANVPVAAMTTLVNNPFTWPIIYPIAYAVGERVMLVGQWLGLAPAAHAHQDGWTHWLMSSAGVVMLGMLILAPLIAGAGYGLAAWGWRLRVARRWRARHAGHLRAEPAPAR